MSAKFGDDLVVGWRKFALGGSLQRCQEL